MTNKEFAKDDMIFKEACEEVKLPSGIHAKCGLARQAGKWRKGKGLAYKKYKNII